MATLYNPTAAIDWSWSPGRPTAKPTLTPAPPIANDDDLLARAQAALRRAADHAYRTQRPDGHWCAELDSNCTITAEYVLMCQALGLDLTERRAAIIQYIAAHQNDDGSWGLAKNYPGDVSTTAECYLALRILRAERSDPRLERAQAYILAHGGLEKMRVFTRINFAMFGLFPWDMVPAVPPELILLPPSSPINIYSFSSWARGTMVPLLVLFHHKPVYALPNGRSRHNDWLDHLWLNPRNKRIPFAKPLRDIFAEHGVSWKSTFSAAHIALNHYEKIQRRSWSRLRRHAVQKCIDWVLERQEPTGDWAGIFPPMVNGILALFAHGHAVTSKPVRLGLAAIERFAIHDDAGFRVEACQSPVWDTTLMLMGLVDGDVIDEPRAARAREWLMELQNFKAYGDWTVNNPRGRPGGWAFEYSNTWYPDVDDTAAVIIALVKHDPASAKSDVIRRAVEWMLSMQNEDGGWAAFDRANDKLFLNELPFSDMDSLCDPSTPDIVGRVLEALGHLKDPRYDQACARGIAYLRASQEAEGSWFGRWGVNYIYGTSNVLCALRHHHLPAADDMIARAVRWMKSVQNADGGWGECLESYENKALMGRGTSTASQTAWALMGLLAFLPPDDPAVRRGAVWLLDRQNAEGTWEEENYTGTGFPKHFYLRYRMYRHYFPLMALGRLHRTLRP